MALRTVALGHSGHESFPAMVARQMPGAWPCGNSVVGNTLFIPPVGGRLRGDWLVVLTPPPANLNTDIPRSRRILFLQEPPEVWTPAPELLRQFGYIASPYPISVGGCVTIPSVTAGLFWWYGVSMDGHRPIGRMMTWEEIRSAPGGRKVDLVSTITSSKTGLPGHRSRLEFTLRAQQALEGRLHVFGHGIKAIADKREALDSYRFHLAIENSIHPHYWTEKLADAILGRCVVFYHGSPEARKVFPGESVIPIDIHRAEEAIAVIRQRIEESRDVDADLEAAREKILSLYSFPHYCDRLIDAIEAESDGT